MTRHRIRSYAEAARFLGRSDERGTGQRGTVVVRLTASAIAVRYHNTDVVTYHHPATGRVATLDNGGYRTPTTVSRINEYCPDEYGAELYDHGVWAGHLRTGEGAWLDLGSPLEITQETGAAT
jgi:hypothetical protein